MHVSSLSLHYDLWAQEPMKGRHDTQHNNIQHNETQNKGLICAIQQNDTWHNDTQHNSTLSLCWMSHFCYAECHYANCGYAKCRYAECRNAECRSANEGTEYTNKPVRWNEYQAGILIGWPGVNVIKLLGFVTVGGDTFSRLFFPLKLV